MPRSKRRSAADMTPSGEEDRSYSSKRLRNSNSSRRVSSSSTHGSMDSSAAGAAAALQQPHNPYHYHHHQQQQQQPLNTTPHHHHHHHQHNPHHHHHHHHSNTTTTSANMVVPTMTATNTPYSQKRCLTWFREYTGKDDPEQLGPDGMEKFCEDIGVEPENVVMLVLAYKMQARRMGYFTKEEWLKGLGEMQCDSIQKLQYRLDYLRQVLNDLNTFKAIYRYAYEFARDKDQRSMDMETAKAMLQLLLGKHWQLYSQFSQFLDQSKYKVINKDQWCNILEFSRTIYNDLSNYDVDGAWPVMLDEFVEWLKASRAAATKSSADIS